MQFMSTKKINLGKINQGLKYDNIEIYYLIAVIQKLEICWVLIDINSPEKACSHKFGVPKNMYFKLR